MAASKKPSATSFLNEDTPITDAFETVGDAKIVPPTWIIKDIVPTGLVIYLAPPKNFKSTVILNWALSCIEKDVTALPQHMSQCVRPGPVIMISTETTAGTIKFDALFGLRVHILSSDPLYCQTNPFAFRLDNADNMKTLLWWLNRIRPSMLVFDPLRNSHSIDENDAGAMVAIIQPLQQYAIKNDMALVIVHHTKKPGDKAKPDDILDPNMGRGTSALIGLADGIITQVVTNGPNQKDYDETALPMIRMAGLYKRGKEFRQDVELNVEWALMKMDTEIAANVYNTILEESMSSVKLAETLNLKEVDVLKYTNYMYKNKIISKSANGKVWEVEQ